MKVNLGQIDNIDSKLKYAIWNTIQLYVLNPLIKHQENEEYWMSVRLNSPNLRLGALTKYSFFNRVCVHLAFEILDCPGDVFCGSIENRLTELRNIYWRLEWYKVYDLIEYCSEHDFLSTDDFNYSKTSNTVFIEKMNSCLIRNGSGYMIFECKIVGQFSEKELAEVEEIVGKSSIYSIRYHIEKALGLLSNRENPDFPNSIKESITAVEATVQILIGKHHSLGAGLKTVKNRFNLSNEKFINAIQKLYDYTNSEEGIRHTIRIEASIGYFEAKYFLVACSAFCNYLLSLKPTTSS